MPTAEPTIQKVALYARVSTDEQREGQTIDSQVAEIERFARDRTWQVTGVYKDEGWSGALMARPELDRLRDDARKGFFQAVLINDVDRLARDVAHLGIIKRDLERQGARVVFRKLPTDTSPTSNLMVNILGSFAEFERELIADRTRRGRRHKIEVRKQYLGSRTAYGYRYVPKDRAADKEATLSIEPQEAAIVRRMFDWVDREGLSARKVMLRLNERRVPTQQGRSQWSKSSVLRILHNETYCGTWHYNKHQRIAPPENIGAGRVPKYGLRTRPRHEWLPLELPQPLLVVPRQQWEHVQEQLRQNISFSPRNEIHRYLLKSLVRCGGCGGPYVGEPCHGKFYYRCGKRCKLQPLVAESILNQTVMDAVRHVLIHPDVIIEPIRKLELADRAQKKRRQSDAKAAEKDLVRLDNEEQRLLEAYRTGVITPAQLGTQLEKLNQKRQASAAVKEELAAEPVLTTESANSVRDYCAEAAANLDTFSIEEWQQLLRAVIQRIVFAGDSLTILGRVEIPAREDGDAKATAHAVRFEFQWAGSEAGRKSIASAA